MKNSVPFDYNDASYWENNSNQEETLPKYQYQDMNPLRSSSIIDPKK